MDSKNQYRYCRKLLVQIRTQLERLETGEDTSVDLQGDVASRVNDLSRRIEEVEAGVKGDREWERKVRNLMEESRGLRKSLDHFLENQHLRARRQAERDELFGGMNPSAQELGSTQALLKEQNSLRAIGQSLDEYVAHSTAVLQSLVDQKTMLKGAQRKMLDVVSTLGLSKSMIRLVERRHLVDRWIVYAGMGIVTLFLYFMIQWRNSTGYFSPVEDADPFSDDGGVAGVGGGGGQADAAASVVNGVVEGVLDSIGQMGKEGGTDGDIADVALPQDEM
eukprot:Rmarinus@m.6930